MSDARALAEAVLTWWHEHRYDTLGDSESGDERNVYDEEPEMVQMARSVLGELLLEDARRNMFASTRKNLGIVYPSGEVQP